MEKKSFLFAFWVMLIASVSAQNKITVTASVGDDLNTLLATSRFFFPEFQDADVYLTRGTTTRAKLNYDLLAGKMMFIAKTDTLVLTSDVQTIVFEKHTFRYTPKGFLEVIAYNPEKASELLLMRSLQKTSERKEGGYGKAPESASVTSFSNFSQDATISSLSVTSDVTFKKEQTYYLFLKGRFRIADKSGFLKTYAKKKTEISGYLEKSPVDFENGEDVLRLYIFCEE